VLVGHSFGGLYVLTFAATYPDQVDLVGRLAALLPAVAPVGVTRLVNQVSYGNLPPRARDEARARSTTASFLNESRAGAWWSTRPPRWLTLPTNR
jgi:pimeloyl-ACP methyl ester carboxylesterase